MPPDSPPRLLTAQNVRDLLQSECDAAGGQSVWARDHGVTPSLVSATLYASRDPGPMILAALGLRRVNRYVAVQPAAEAADAE